MELPTALAFATEHRRSVLVTLRRDGRPQSSNVMHVVQDGCLVVSVTDDRAKTRNARRDARVSLHVSAPDFWSYVVIDGTAELTPVAADPGDATVEALVGYYRDAAGEHPDWDDYRREMVRERRLLLRVRPEHAYGMLPRSA
ncbi:PPOX class F420-dependent oxidoreductase [Aquipuribacter nitratireducens]|uniref:PPOX class F420-dependent oxidoreductase n=1 Tax=Aquipuribacter nitratireducens TaxID=650104 RepID=A0ABW0GMK9_9MICO